MLTTLNGTRDELPSQEEAKLAAYRYEVFVKTLEWDLSGDHGLERDQFDRSDTVYIIVKDGLGFICGCARLLPTTEPYLLAELFPQFLHGMPAPRSREVWELSRFSTQPAEPNRTLTREESRRRFCTVFAGVVRSAMAHGAVRLITFTAPGIERILRTIGIHAHRVGPPVCVEGKPVLSLWIELDRKTCDALNIGNADDASGRRDGLAPELSSRVEASF